MATTGILNMPVVDRETNRICGSIGAQELLIGRKRAVVRESQRNIVFRFPVRGTAAVAAQPDSEVPQGSDDRLQEP